VKGKAFTTKDTKDTKEFKSFNTKVAKETKDHVGGIMAVQGLTALR
jgi:hypothetical protein